MNSTTFLLVLTKKNEMPIYRLFRGSAVECAEYCTAINEEGEYSVRHSEALTNMSVWSKRPLRRIDQFYQIQGEK